LDLCAGEEILPLAKFADGFDEFFFIDEFEEFVSSEAHEGEPHFVDGAAAMERHGVAFLYVKIK
jgi:hypothetical protein